MKPLTYRQRLALILGQPQRQRQPRFPYGEEAMQKGVIINERA